MFKLLPGYDESPMTELAMQLPMFSWGSAYAPDLNHDGVLDLYHHNHLRFSKANSRWSDPSTSPWGPKKGGCMVDWDAVLRNGTDGTYYAANDGNGFIKTTDDPLLNKQDFCHDTHSAAFIDIDGDSITDFYVVTGAGFGVGNAKKFDNAIYWGEKDEASELGFRLVGGKDAALEAGLQGRSSYGNERGRHQYWFDADGDGLMDVVTLNGEREDDVVSPGLFYRNIDGRKFNVTRSNSRNFEEFAFMAVLTDLDGDGFAKELIVPSQCNPGSSTNNAVCKKSPMLSLTVYQFDSKRDNLRRKTITQPPKGLGKNDVANGIATQDFDLDGKPDVAILRKERVDFYLSSSRRRRCAKFSDDAARQFCLLRMGRPNAKFDLTSLCGGKGSSGFRFADFNLNGKIDMMVVCKSQPGHHGIYELSSSMTWQKLKNPDGTDMDFGDLNSLRYGQDPEQFCKGVPTTNADTVNSRQCRRHQPKKVCESLLFDKQFAICSIFKNKRDPVYAFPPTVADLDNDGFVDVIVGYKFAPMVILRNILGDTGDKNRFLALSFEKRVRHASSIGAIVQLTAIGMGPNENETTRQLRVVSTRGHETDAYGGSEDRIIFGLGPSGTPVKLQIQWPHCCTPTILWRKQLTPFLNSMDSPFEVPAPSENCDRSCFKN